MKNHDNLAINVESLYKEFQAGKNILNGLSFRVKKGTIHGFLGPNGAGKTTTMKIICGLLNKTKGEVTIKGSLGYLPENPPLYNDLSVSEYLKFTADIRLYTNFDLNKLLKDTWLFDLKDRAILNLSKGQKQRVGIAQALLHEPDIIILDEPTVGLDPISVMEMRKLMMELSQRHTILFSTHLLNEVEMLCSDVTLINCGSLLYSGSIEGIKKIKSGECILAITENWGHEVENKFKNLFPESQINLINKEKMELEIKNINKNNISAVAEFLAQKEIGLLEFRQIETGLEESFSMLVRGLK